MCPGRAPAYGRRMDALAARASALVAPPRGILATGPGGTALSGRLAAAGVPPTGENRRAFRELLVTAPGLRAGLSGVILDAEGMDQRSSDGLALPETIGAAGLMTGVRANADRRPLPGTRSETITEGLDGLPARLEGWARRGAVFATWRAVLRIGPGTPSLVAIRANAQALGRYAAACQAAGLVPVVAPHLAGGGLHPAARLTSPQRGRDVAGAAGGDERACGVRGGPGGRDPQADHDAARTLARARESAGESAEATVRTLAGVPLTLAGVAFAGDSQRPERAT